MRLKRRAEQSTLWPGALPASPPAWQDDGREVLTCDGSGLSFSASAARLLPAGSWQRTLSASVASSLTGSTGCAVSLRLRATKCGRSLLVPTMSGRPTEGSESGSLLGWTSPRAIDANGIRTGKALTDPRCMSKPSLTQQAEGMIENPHVWREWPTASATPYGNNRGGGAGRVGPVRPSLEGAARLWPTATSGDGKASGTCTGTPNAVSTASHGGTTLTDAANGPWASPQARDWKDSGPTQGNRKSPNLGTQAWATPRTSDVAAGRIVDEKGRRVSASGVFGINLSDQVAAGRLAPDSPSTSGKRRGSRPGRVLIRSDCGHSWMSTVEKWSHQPCPKCSAISSGDVTYLDLPEGPPPEWGTPTSHERTHSPRPVDHGRQLANQVRGSLNPAWVESLLGFPPGWLAASPPATAARRSRRSETPSSRSVPRSSAKRSSKRKGG